MDFRKYEVFLRAIECGSLTKAGCELGYTQSGVSHMMKGLEDEVGFRLFSRGRAGVELTSEGARIVPIIRELSKWNEQLNQTLSLIKGFELGTIRIATIASISFNWLPRIIRRFLEDFPNIDIDIMEGGAEEIKQWLAERRADIGFISVQENSEGEAVPLKKDRFLAVLPPDFPVDGRKFFPLSDFNEQTFIISTRGIDYDIHRILENNNVTPKIKFSSTDDNTIISMVANGLGVSILPELMLAGHMHRVRTMRLKPEIFRTLGMVVPSMKDTSPAAKKFMEYVSCVLEEK